MPWVDSSRYRSPAWLPGGHLQTIVPALFRRVPHVTRQPERLELPDGDFLDLEWSGFTSDRLAILSHGLEADTRTAYIQGLAAYLIRHGWDVLAWNFRGCGREPNRLPRFYHSGATEDLHAVIGHALDRHPATAIDLAGFSLGGNLTLKYLGEARDDRSARLHRAVAFSVPCDLACSSRELARPSNAVYMERFLRSLRAKVRAKSARHPDAFDLAGLDRLRSFREFDNRFTAPLHGFRDAADYWRKCSCRGFLSAIRIPTLLVNAANDPFLGPACHPRDEAAASPWFFFEQPATGGHVGFPGSAAEGAWWPDRRALAFLEGREGNLVAEGGFEPPTKGL